MKIIMLLVSIVFASNSYAADVVKVKPAQTILEQENGRYVFGQISDFRSDQYLLDTKTGKLWTLSVRKYRNADGTEATGADGYRVLDPVPFVMPDGSLSLDQKQ